MGAELIIIGSTSALVAVGAFSGAVRETLRLTSLRALYDNVVQEPVPETILVMFEGLGEDDGDLSK